MSHPEFVVQDGKARQAGTLQAGPYMDTVRRKCEKSLYLFSKLVMGYDRFSDTFHKPMCEWLQTVPPRRKCFLAPRDHYKTSIAMSLAIHLIIQPKANNIYWKGRDGSDLRILYAGETIGTASTRLIHIRTQFESNELLRAMWPEKVWDDLRQARDWTQEKITLPRPRSYPEGNLEVAGTGTAVTGRHYNVAIKDDLIGLRARQEITTTMPSAIEWYKSSKDLMDPPMEYLEFIFGTRWAQYDLYQWLDKNEKALTWKVRKVIEDGLPILPEHISLEYIEQELKPKGEIYWLNYMNEVSGEGLTAFDTSRLRYFELGEDGDLILDTFVPEHKPDEREGMSFDAEAPPPVRKQSTPQERVTRWRAMHDRFRRDRENRYD